MSNCGVAPFTISAQESDCDFYFTSASLYKVQKEVHNSTSLFVQNHNPLWESLFISQDYIENTLRVGIYQNQDDSLASVPHSKMLKFLPIMVCVPQVSDHLDNHSCFRTEVRSGSPCPYLTYSHLETSFQVSNVHVIV